MHQDLVTTVDEKTTKDGKILAIIAHFPVLGTLIAWVLNLTKKNEFISFYTRQMIGYQVLTCLIEGVVSRISGFIAWGFGIALFIFWIISLFGVFNDKLKLMPIVGPYFQKIFRSL